MDIVELELDGSHEFDRFAAGWLILARITCVCGWKGRARWPSAAGIDRCADELIDHQIELCGRPAR